MQYARYTYIRICMLHMLMCWTVWSNVPVPVGVVVASAVVVSLAAVR